MSMLPYLLYTLVVLGLPLVGLLPPTRLGRAFNGLFTIRMPDPSVYGVRHKAVHVQEICEWYFAHLVPIVACAVPAYLLSAYAPLGLATPLLPLLAWQWRTTDEGRRQCEYVGWAAEFAEGQHSAPYQYDGLTGHADQLRRGYAVFSGYTTVEIEASLKRRLPLAKALRLLLTLYIRRHAA